MSLKDDEKYLQQLSKDTHIRYFDNIFLVYTYEDGYSPLYSSKIISQNIVKLNNEMCESFWSNTQVGLKSL